MEKLRKLWRDGVSEAKEKVGSLPVYVHCQTCGLPFLNISYNEYLDKSRMMDTGTILGFGKVGEPDKWFVDTLVHWIEYKEHEIFFTSPTMPPTNISDI